MKLSRQRALHLLLAMAGSVVVWAGCGSTVVTNGSGGSSSTGSSSSSGAIVCNGGPDCPDGVPSPGSPCSTPGLCCDYIMCDHMGGNDDTYATCGDAGTWQWP